MRQVLGNIARRCGSRRFSWVVAPAIALSGIAAANAALAATITRTSSFAYDANGLLIQEVVEPDTEALKVRTDYTYDQWGNRTSVTVSGADIATRTSTTAYDSRGQFVVRNVNALGHTESIHYDDRFGTPDSHVGPNGLHTTWTYDSLGRKVSEVRPDGNRTFITYETCVDCLPGSAYFVRGRSYAVDGVTQNDPPSLIFYDRLDRELGRYAGGFDGNWVVALREYDAAGRVSTQSRPVTLVGSPTFKKTSFSYDVLGRLVTATAPDGSVTRMEYHGLVTAETNALNQRRTVVKNARGEVVAVTDALGQTMSYAYDPVGNLVQTTDADGNIVTATYDIRGRKIATHDPNLGQWFYLYDVLGQLTRQADAKGQITNVTYDPLGRPLRRIEPDMTTEWTYDIAVAGIGKPSRAEITAGPSAGYSRHFSYDSLGRPSGVTTVVDGNLYTFTAGYDGNGRLSRVAYPSGFVARYDYSAFGYAAQLRDEVTNQAYWDALAMDGEQHLTRQRFGNGVESSRFFNAETGRLDFVRTGAGDTVQNLDYTYDRLGNPLSRRDNNVGFTENFSYDPLNRLVQTTLSNSAAPLRWYAYGANGNMLVKSDVGNYTYPPPGSPRPHAVTSIIGNSVNTTFTYDANGNQLSGLGRTIEWTAYNKPARITQGSRTISFLDDVNHQRFKQVTPEGTTLYIGAFGVMTERFIGAGGGGRWNDYLSVGNVPVGVRIDDDNSEAVTTRYFHTDHLGSVSVITNESGAVIEYLSYDPWGKRRFRNGVEDSTASITSQTTHGFTGEEHLSVASLVHLNGRVYDPVLGRMISADPFVPDALNPQAWNRYSYVGNDPLAFTDPGGFSWLSNFFHGIKTFLQTNPLVTAILKIAISAVLMAVLPVAGFTVMATVVASAVVSTAIVTGLSGGRLGDILKNAAIAGATALAFLEVGQLTPGANLFGSPAHAANVAGHAAVGCASAVASGGECGSGALSAAAGTFAGPLIPTQNFVGKLVVISAVGGAASVVGGGSFANGAVTAAFGYLFNQLVHPEDPVQARLQSLANRAVAEFDALGDAGFTQGQRDAIEKEPWLRPMYRGYNIDNLVRRYVAADDLVSHLQGRINSGVDFIDPRTGKLYEMTTPGEWSSKVRIYGSDTRFINTGRGAGGTGAGGTNLPLPKGGPFGPFNFLTLF